MDRLASPTVSLALLLLFGAPILYLFGEPHLALVLVLCSALFGFASLTPGAVAGRFSPDRIPFGPLTWKLEDFVRHWLIVGRSGCGKTLAAIKTLAINFYRSVPHAGGLVIDQKGDFAAMFNRLLRAVGQKDKVVLLQCPLPHEHLTEPSLAINLLGESSITLDDYADIIVNVAVSQGQKTSNEFFKFAARDTIRDILYTLKVGGIPVTLCHAHEFLASKDDQTFVLQSVSATEEHYSEIVAEIMQKKPEDITPEDEANLEDAKRLQKEAGHYVKHWEKFYSGYQGQFEGIVGQATNYLRPYATKGLENTFSAAYRKDLVSLFDLLDQGKVIAPSIPQAYGASRGYVMAFFKVLYYTYGMRRFDALNLGQKIGPPCVLWIDEAQNSLLRSEEGISDINSLDKLRAANCGVVFAMQCFTSAIPALETEAKADVLFTNLNNMVMFSLNHEKGRKIAADSIGQDELDQRSYTYDRSSRRSVQHSKQRKHILPPIFFRRLPKFKAVILHTEGRHAIATLPPLTDDGKHVEKWFLGTYLRTLFFSW